MVVADAAVAGGESSSAQVLARDVVVV